MAVQTMALPPIFVDNTEFHADPVRRFLSELLNGKPGFFGDDVMQSEIGEDYTVTVSPGVAALPSPSEDFRGVFLVELDASVSLPIEPPHATQDRVDVLVGYVVPPEGDQAGSWMLEVRTGTPAANPVVPTIPGALVLDEIRVPAEADSELPWTTDRRQANGQVFHGAVVITSEERPEDVRAGTLWLDWQNGNVWAWEGFKWYAVGVPSFASQADRNAGFPGTPGNGQLAITRDIYGLWVYAGSNGWQVLGDTLRASHALSLSGPVNHGQNPAVGNITWLKNGGVATLVSGSATDIRLNRQGRWSMTVVAFSDSGSTGLSSVRIEYPNGPFAGTNLTDSSWRGGGFGGAGSLNQTVSWSGNVSAVQAQQPFRVTLGWLATTGNTAASYTVSLMLEYLGM